MVHLDIVIPQEVIEDRIKLRTIAPYKITIHICMYLEAEMANNFFSPYKMKKFQSERKHYFKNHHKKPWIQFCGIVLIKTKWVWDRIFQKSWWKLKEYNFLLQKIFHFVPSVFQSQKPFTQKGSDNSRRLTRGSNTLLNSKTDIRH